MGVCGERRLETRILGDEKINRFRGQRVDERVCMNTEVIVRVIKVVAERRTMSQVLESSANGQSLHGRDRETVV